MSLQPGPDDRADDSTLTPRPDSAPEFGSAAEAGSTDGSPAADAGPAGGSPLTPEQPAPWDSQPRAPWESPPPAPWAAGPPPPAPPPGGPAPDPGRPYGGAPGAPGTFGGSPLGYGPPAPGAGAWGPGGYPAPVGTESKAIVGLVLAILSWVFCPVVLAVAALVVAAQSDRAIAASHGAQDGRGMNTATRWISWANIVVFALVIVAAIIFIAFAATVGPSISLDESTQF